MNNSQVAKYFTYPGMDSNCADDDEGGRISTCLSARNAFRALLILVYVDASVGTVFGYYNRTGPLSARSRSGVGGVVGRNSLITTT